MLLVVGNWHTYAGDAIFSQVVGKHVSDGILGHAMVIDFSTHENDHSQIWRYGDFTKYLSLLHTQAAFIARSDKFDDQYEGFYPNIREILGPDYSPNLEFNGSIVRRADRDVAEKETLRLAVYELRFRTFIWCWRLNAGESEAMWGLYPQYKKEGIAIVSTVSKLAQSLHGALEEFTLTKVDYRNCDWSDPSTWPTDKLEPFIRKRESFDHEKEIRAVCQVDDTSGKSGIDLKLGADGLNALIDHVVVAPTASDRFVGLVRSLTDRFGCSFPVSKSELAGVPDWSDAERIARIKAELPDDLVIRKPGSN